MNAIPIPNTIPSTQKVINISTGYDHVMLITNHNLIYALGSVKHGCLGCIAEQDIDDFEYYLNFPRIVKLGKGDVISVVCGYYYTLVLMQTLNYVDEGIQYMYKIYGFGHYLYNGLGDDVGVNSYFPKQIVLNNINLNTEQYSLQLIGGMKHNFIFIQNKKIQVDQNNNNYIIYAFGDNTYGQCCVNLNEHTLIGTPLAIDLTKYYISKVKSLSCGSFHTIIMDSNSIIYSFGQNYNSQIISDENNTRLSTDIPVPLILDNDLQQLLNSDYYSIQTSCSQDYSFIYTYFNINKIENNDDNISNIRKENIELDLNESRVSTFLYDNYFNAKLKYKNSIRNIGKSISDFFKPFQSSRESQIKQISVQWRTEYLPNLLYYQNTNRLPKIVRQGIPSTVRSAAWSKLIGNSCNATKSIYEICKQKALHARKYLEFRTNRDESYDLHSDSKILPSVPNEGISSVSNFASANSEINEEMLIVFGREETVRMIDQDLARTFPALKFFEGETAMHEQLRNLLEAYTFFRPDLGYVQGMSYLAGMLLLYMEQDEAFIALCNLLNGKSIFPFYLFDLDQIEKRVNIFKWALAEVFPGIAIFLEEMGFEFRKFILEWFMTLYVKTLDLEVCARVWDVLLVEGQLSLYKFGLAIFKLMQNDIFDADSVGDVYMALGQIKNKIEENTLIKFYENIHIPNIIVDEIMKLELTDSRM